MAALPWTPLSLSAFLAGAGALIGLLGFPWIVLRPRAAIIFLLASVATGQLIRIPLPGQGGGLLLSDLAVTGVLFAALYCALRTWYLPISARWALLVMTPFIIWTGWGLIWRVGTLPLADMAVGVLYWTRLVSDLLVLPALLVLITERHEEAYLGRGFLLTTLLLAILGFAQTAFLPDLTKLPAFLTGWDPHQHRLVSTWLDPNFMGIFFVISLYFVMGIPWRSRVKPLVCVALLATALALTGSRSSFVALGLATCVIFPFWLLRRPDSRAVHLVGIGLLSMVVASTLGVFILLGSRGVTVLTHDPTVQIRLSALQSLWPIVARYAWIGSGYNLFQFVSPVVNNFRIHSRAGADNSFLTLLITTGIPGLIMVAGGLTVLGFELIRRWFQGGSLPALLSVGALLALCIDAQFVNSLLYSHLLIALWCTVAYAL